MKCPHCQADNPDTSKYCRKCGKSIRVEAVRPKCGHTNLADSTFCNECGQPLTPGLTHISRNTPPFFIVQGDNDVVVPLDQSQILYEALKKSSSRSYSARCARGRSQLCRRQ
jgi:acetyl esterase/lipase